MSWKLFTQSAVDNRRIFRSRTYIFPWELEKFQNLHISVYFHEKGQLVLICRVHDFVHNNEYDDRYNERFFLKKGWNDLVIPLADIESAPVNRLMNMDKIEKLKLFVIHQDKEQMIYIDNVYLEK